MSRRAVFLDRDGVINAYVYNSEFGLVDSPSNPGQFVLLPGVAQAIADLNRLGLLVIVVSNQPGIAKGKFSPALLQATNRKMEEEIARFGGKVDAVYYCLHHPDALLPEYRGGCTCRKPAPGLLLAAAQEWDIELQKSYTIGDGIVDVLAGAAAGTTTIFVSPKKCYVCEELARQDADPDYFAEGLPAAVEILRLLEAGEPPIGYSPCDLANVKER